MKNKENDVLTEVEESDIIDLKDEVSKVVKSILSIDNIDDAIIIKETLKNQLDVIYEKITKIDEKMSMFSKLERKILDMEKMYEKLINEINQLKNNNE